MLVSNRALALYLLANVLDTTFSAVYSRTQMGGVVSLSFAENFVPLRMFGFAMSRMKKRVQKKNKTPHTVVGTWFNGDEYETEVEYIVSYVRGSFAVRAVDRSDGEEGEVYDVKWDGNALSFAVYWNSTGRLVKARLLTISRNRVDYTYTYTEQEMWYRKETEPSVPPNR